MTGNEVAGTSVTLVDLKPVQDVGRFYAYSEILWLLAISVFQLILQQAHTERDRSSFHGSTYPRTVHGISPPMQILYQFLAYTRSWVIPPITINFAVEINTLYKIRNFIYVTKLRIHNITVKAALKFESEAWVPKKREKQRLEAAQINPLKPELNPIFYLLALLGAHHFLHVSRIRVKSLTFRRLMSYIYIWSTHS